MRDLPKTVKNVVWLQTSFLGDLVLATGAFKALAKLSPDIGQHLITTKTGIAALTDFPYLKHRIVFDKRSSRFNPLRAFSDVKNQLREHGLLTDDTVVLQMHRSLRSTLLASYLRLPFVTFMESSLSLLANVRISRSALLHEAFRLALLLEGIGLDRRKVLAACKPMLTPLPLISQVPWQSELKTLLQQHKKIVAIAPGSVWGTKRWLPESYLALTKQLLAQGHICVLIGGQDEQEICNDLYQQLKTNQYCLNLAGKTDLDDLRRIYPTFHLLVSNDSSPIHYASAFNVPTVALFGATVPSMGFAPLAEKSVSLGVDLDCRPCSDHGPQTCPLGHFNCMRQLSVQQVFRSAQQLLI